ncbi:MAG TPA: MoaD/ThiS family protein [Holophaga sp.]|nr:MoaD/ThiS family protein [Holophaga sp.]HPS67007.1 MoaD/ThiS family protein [Holophaga sp.]
MVIVRAFARYRDVLGFQMLEMPLPDPPVLGVLLGDPRLAGLPAEALLAVNQAFADRACGLRDGDEVALMPPVSGG